MEPQTLIAREALAAVVDQMATDLAFVDRIIWWLQGGHAAERWVQFEFAYRLQPTTSEWAVVCELDRVDVAVRRIDDPTSPPVAGLEMKWVGNWWPASISAVEGDLRKVATYGFPAAVMLLFLSVTPRESTGPLGWVHRQIAEVGGAAEAKALVARSGLSRTPDFEHGCPLLECPSLRHASLEVFVWYNSPARAPA